jgi:hypothetical protein
VLVIVALVGWWVVTRPKAMRLEASAPVAAAADGLDLIPAADGLVVLHPSATAPHDATHAARYDWHGNRTWEIALPPAALRGWTIPDGEPCRVTAASPDGRVLATLAPSAPGAVQLVTWRDGIELGRVSLAAQAFNSVTNWPYPALHVRDDGRVLIYQAFPRVSPLVLVEGQHIRARGTHTIKSPSPNDSYARLLSPDGEALVAISLDEPNVPTPFEYDQLAQRGDRLSVSLCYDGACPSAPAQMLDGGLFVSPDGVVYDATGEIYRHGAWETFPSVHPAANRCVVQRRESQMLVFTPTTRRLWSISAGDWITTLSSDGRYALATHSGAAHFRAWSHHPGGEPYTLRLFTRPGWLTAILPLTMTADTAMHLAANGQNARVADYAVSERHHRVALLGVQAGGRPTLFIYRW